MSLVREKKQDGQRIAFCKKKYSIHYNICPACGYFWSTAIALFERFKHLFGAVGMCVHRMLCQEDSESKQFYDVETARQFCSVSRNLPPRFISQVGQVALFSARPRPHTFLSRLIYNLQLQAFS